MQQQFEALTTEILEQMLQDEMIIGKTILTGNGHLAEYLISQGADSILTIENNREFRHQLSLKCQIIAPDLLLVNAEQVSHVQLIVLAPPLFNDTVEILHAFEIGCPGCKIISLCNPDTIDSPRTRSQARLCSLIDDYGSQRNLKHYFQNDANNPEIKLSLIALVKPGCGYDAEFEGFFMDDDQPEAQENGLMPYNAVRDIVNRYMEAIKIFDDQLAAAVRMNNVTADFYSAEMAMRITKEGIPKARNEFKKEMQKSGWKYIFDKLALNKYSTSGLKQDINRFVEEQKNIPFTMRNIYRMLEIVIGTATQRMDRCLLEVFDQITRHHHENRWQVEGWKTNSHYLVNKRFILSYICYQDSRYYKGESRIRCDYHSHLDQVEDLVKALCFITGDRYERIGSLHDWISYPYKTLTANNIYFHSSPDGYHGHLAQKEELFKKGIACTMVHSEPVYGQWFDWAYFRVKGHKKGSMHFEFLDEKLWATFNQHIARLKKYPLFEPKAQTPYQRRQTNR